MIVLSSATPTTKTTISPQSHHIPNEQEQQTSSILRNNNNTTNSNNNNQRISFDNDNNNNRNKLSTSLSSYGSADSQPTTIIQLTTTNLIQNVPNDTAADVEPSTPTSIKGSRSETSEVSHETAPSSIENNHIEVNDTLFKAPTTIRTSIEIDPLDGNHSPTPSSQSTIKNTPISANKPTSTAIAHSTSLPATTNIRRHTTSSIGITRAHSLHTKVITTHNKIIEIPTSTTTTTTTNTATATTTAARIHPNRTESAIALSRHSIAFERPLSRSTFPAFTSHQELPISTKNDLQKIRDSILMKRNLNKKKLMEDDNRVLMGNKISEGHENFVMAYNMLTGIRVAVSRCSGVRKKLIDQDFKSTKKLSFNMDGSELTPSSKYDFKFKDYCPEVFRELRLLFGIDPADYLVSITGKYILSELGSPGKSGSFFYYSRDYRFIIKTIRHSEHRQLRSILKNYHQHVKDNPNTLISQFYGLHRVKMPIRGKGTRKVHFVVMNNLFPPHRDIHLKYDLKGSTWGRITKLDPNSPPEEISKHTLKDLNFLQSHQKIQFGPAKRSQFFKQLESDVKFLESIKVMDYSLLLGIHDVKKGNTTYNQTGLSVFEPPSSDKRALIATNPRDLKYQDLPNDVFPGRSKYVFYGHDGGIRATNEDDNSPLGQIYYLGIIDCLTGYGPKKRLETFFRGLGGRNKREVISAVPPREYGERFLRFIKEGTSGGRRGGDKAKKRD
ncbi:MSS4 [[Candida] subhashii]|uniref:1-phosphatidylinositol-4-phosphate 5-kinase n=1 Tax=[Candida] subhashii TaxID=561895 RepID=A0A8J5Q4X0_9ASCO|nr:MSS4 [[Candida] subhashii]KAG7660531.1 MSS4 [[Candida] subhashii]